MPVWARFSALVQTCREVHPVCYTMGTGSFPGVKRPGRGVDHPPLPEPSERKSRFIPLLHTYSFVTCSRKNLNLSMSSKYCPVFDRNFGRQEVAMEATAKQDKQSTYKRNIELHSCNHCCSGKAVSITYSVCVCL
jgi:hypothetical protein